MNEQYPPGESFQKVEGMHAIDCIYQLTGEEAFDNATVLLARITAQAVASVMTRNGEPRAIPMGTIVRCHINPLVNLDDLIHELNG